LVRWAVLLIYPFLSLFSAQIVFDTLADPLKNSIDSIEKLSQKPVMEPNKMLLKNFVQGVEATLAVGDELSHAKEVDRAVLGSYLKNLRELSKTKDSIDALYRQSLNTAINQSDKKSFVDLISVPLDPLHHPQIRSEVIAFYQKNFPTHSIKNIEVLSDEQALETKSIQYIEEQEEAWEEHLRVLKRSEADKIKKTAKKGSRESVLLSEESDGHGGFILEAENLNPYTVTMNIDVTNLKNLATDVRLPLFVEIHGESRKNVLHLSRISASQEVQHQDSYGWVIGSAYAQHQNDYVYRLPFVKNYTVEVTQGYNGALSHKGLSTYAVDFGVPVGTSVYAAREGKVVETEVSNSLGGPSPEYRPYMNRIRVEHSDGTFGNYCHLKVNGSAVQVGQIVKKGDLLGYSGNTGYCTAPHLHFSVSKVDPISMRRPMNLPIKMQTAQGIVTLPQKGERYTVQ
jgi:murein DD-endopeptidase MepM/ murein hydrolase activator NlpD